jgi:pimeloyl-ACP methyl ester carboxylesterase
MKSHFVAEGIERGRPALLLLPGWCNDSSVFSAVLPRLRTLDCGLVTLEWRWHNEPRRATEDFGHAELVDDALSVVAELALEDLMIVAMAQAGWVAVELCRALGGRVRGLVLVDWLVGEPEAEFWAALQGLQAPGSWHRVRQDLFAAWVGGARHEAVRSFARRQAEAHGFEMWARSAREIERAYRRWESPLAALESLKSPPPTLHVYALPEDPRYLEMQLRFAQANRWYRPERLANGKTHYPLIEQPDEVVAKIGGFLELVHGA